MCVQLLKDPTNFVLHLGRMTASTVRANLSLRCCHLLNRSQASSMAYGFRLPDSSSSLAQEMMHNSHGKSGIWDFHAAAKQSLLTMEPLSGFFHCVVESQVLDWYPSLRPMLRMIPRQLNPLARKAVRAYEMEQKVFRKAYEMGLNSPVPCQYTHMSILSQQHS